ncbi:MAG: FtsW/RodA/SpoVE family cell cycle protein [Actinomycetaceae bacterium]|nr:FtsW/RodA/SpoVE family cell cycle protein [Actinomycetaceae bacterium]MDY6082408.1 FtsW/RodA/SpoVE family cell cycle protein [Actinomycetaceae bacterium]
MSVVVPPQAKKGRGSELFLLLLALGIGALAWKLVVVGVGGTPGASGVMSGSSARAQAAAGGTGALPPGFWTWGAAMAALTVIVHLILRHSAPWADPILFPSALLLNLLGLAMIYRIDLSLGTRSYRSQLILTCAGLVAMIITVLAIRDHRVLRRFTFTSLAAGLGLLLLPLVPGIGRELYGSRIWINVAGFSFQPGELAKLCFAVFFAGYLVMQRDNLALAGRVVLGFPIPKARHLIPILTAWILCLLTLAFEEDFGTALLFFGLFVVMLYVATERVSWLVIGGALTAVAALFIVRIEPHIQARITVWLHAMDPDVYNARGGSYQVVQGFFGMGSGGLFGTGFGHGYPTLTALANSDFIVASFGEEIGLAGLLALLTIYLVIVVRGLRIGTMLRDGFGKLLATGLAFILALQCFVVVGGITRLIPLTGLAMPFLAHGGSALLTNWILIGLLLRMSDASRRPNVSASSGNDSGSMVAITTRVAEQIGLEDGASEGASDAASTAAVQPGGTQ